MIIGLVKRALAKTRKRRRDLDVMIFWPSCKKTSESVRQARAAFAYHAMNDPAWTVDMTDHEIIEFVGELR